MTIVVSTFASFIGAAAHYTDPDNRRAPREWRTGQAVFNLLQTVNIDLYMLITGSDFDPFYDDDRLPLFYDYLMRHWDDGMPEGGTEPSGPNGEIY